MAACLNGSSVRFRNGIRSDVPVVIIMTPAFLLATKSEVIANNNRLVFAPALLCGLR